MTQPQAYITVGKLGRTRGVRGEIYVTPATDFPDRFVGLASIFVLDRGRWRSLDIEWSLLIAGRPVLKFREFNTPEEVARLTNRELAVTREEVVDLPEGMHYVFDVVDCEAVESGSGRRIGLVVDVQQYPANDVYVVRTDDNRDIMIPAVREYVLEVDTANKRVVIQTSGLLDK